MILRNNDIDKLDLNINKFILFHGKNDGLKDEKISNLIKKYKENKIFKYDEKEILDNKDNFFDSIFNESLFDNKKLIIINRSTEKILTILELLFSKNISDIIFIINANILEKRSKLRSVFEKGKNIASIPFYQDTNETLITITQNFFKKIKIPISFENINIIVNRCNGDRGYLNNELKKIELFSKNKKNIETIDLIKLTNLTENFSINELVDVCLSKNKKKTINILNENNFKTEDNILIIRTFLNKSKKLLNLINNYQINKNLNETIINAKPPIFWKDRDIVKQQIKYWSPKNIKELIYDLNELEIQIKKISHNSIYLISDFILEKSNLKTNN